MKPGKLSLGFIADTLGLYCPEDKRARSLTAIHTDTRRHIQKGSLFVALPGENVDGADFVQDAIQQGCAAIITRQPVEDEHVFVFCVPDTLAALQRLAGAWRQLFERPVVAITGSNGKTIVKEMLTAIMAKSRTVYRSPGSYNSQIGVALSLLGIREHHELAVIEAGISKPDEMDRLAEIIDPDAGILTSIGLAHRAGLKSRESTAKEKLKLFAGERLQFLVAPQSALDLVGDRADVMVVARTTGDTHPCPADVVVEAKQWRDGWQHFMARWGDNEPVPFRIRSPGLHDVENAGAAIAAALALGATEEEIRQGLESYEALSMRMEIHTTSGQVTLINDTSSADPVSVEAAVSVLTGYAHGGRKIVVLGDMKDLGSESALEHQRIGDLIVHENVDVFVGLGHEARHAVERARELGMSATNAVSLPDLRSLSRMMNDPESALFFRPGDWVLFKASRAMELDTVAAQLLDSVAPARLTVDLEVVRKNLAEIRKSAPGKAIIAVVKSFGYGNDALRISQTLARLGVDMLAVAFPDEGVALRAQGVRLPILVTNVLQSEFDKVVKYDLVAVIHSLQGLRCLQAEAESRGMRGRAHLEIDTGMHRLGFDPGEMKSVVATLRTCPMVDLEGAMTHFAAADALEHDDFSRKQLSTFQGALDELRRDGVAIPFIHASNTAAVWRFPEAHFSGVRVGIGLYGLHPGPDVEKVANVEPALRLSTQIIDIRWVEAGESVGYGRSWKAPRRSRVATIAIGYSDGFPRYMSNGGEVLVGGHRCPVVGTVCMDVAMVDITDVDAQVGPQDEVVVFGSQGDGVISVDEIAARGGTINYEVLCGISPRVRRIFTREG